MKNIKYLTFVFALLLSACEYDNYEPPKSRLTGKIVYEGTPVGVKNDLQVLQIYEPGWQNYEPINVHVSHDGTFSSLLFTGDYKLVLIKGNGPWVDQSDTIDVHISGEKNLEVPVEPFFWISNETYQVNGSTLTATFNLDKVVDTKNLQFVSIFIGENMLVDDRFEAAEQRVPAGEITSLADPVTINMDLSGFSQEYVFARIGVKTKGSSELLFTQVQKIQLQ